MPEVVEREPGVLPAWRQVVDLPLVALLIAVGLFLAAAGLGQAAGSAIVLPSAAKMWARNGVILATVLLTYKLLIVRPGTCPRDDLTGKRALPDLGLGLLIGFALMAASVGAAAIAHVYNFLGEGDASQLFHALIRWRSCRRSWKKSCFAEFSSGGSRNSPAVGQRS